MVNKYLEKIAEDKSIAVPAVEAGAGGYLLSKAPSRMLGYHNLYHGTSKSRAEEIMKNGFDPNKGGTGAAGHSGYTHFKDQSAGKSHFTKNKGTARFFAGYTAYGDKVGRPIPEKAPPNEHIGSRLIRELKNQKALSEHHSKSTLEGVKAAIFPFMNKGKVIKARVSDSSWNNDFMNDPHMMGSKAGAATTTKKVSTNSINAKVTSFLNKRHLRKYYSTDAGKLRGLRGLGLGVAGVGLAAHAGSKLLKDTNDK